jgi:hypothetical protein
MKPVFIFDYIKKWNNSSSHAATIKTTLTFSKKMKVPVFMLVYLSKMYLKRICQ